MEDLGSRIVALLLAISTVVSSQTTITQEHPFLSVKEGESIRLNCSYQGTEYSLQWYKQYPGGQPEFMKLLTRSETAAEDNFEMSLDTVKKTTSLYLKNTQLKDSAVYFCAVEPYNNYKITWGSGTRLIVIPNLVESDPSVYQLAPKEESKESSGVAACLITDYSPNPINVRLHSSLEHEEVNGSAVVAKEDSNKQSASLGVVIWKKNQDPLQCSATYNGKTYQAEKEGDATCKETPSDTPVFETDERLNLLSLTVLGLRLIFFKSIALNLFLTFWAWSR